MNDHESLWKIALLRAQGVTCLLQIAPLARPEVARWLRGSSRLVLRHAAVAATSFGCGEPALVSVMSAEYKRTWVCVMEMLCCGSWM